MSAWKVRPCPSLRNFARHRRTSGRRSRCRCACFARAGADMAKITTPLVLKTSGRLTIAVSDVRLASSQVQQDRCSL